MATNTTISKLNKTYINNQTKLNAQDFQENANKIDELVDQVNKPGIYRLTGNLDAYTINTEIELTDSLQNYDYIILATGAVSTNNYRHSVQMPYAANFTANQRSKASLQAWIDANLVATTLTGKIVLKTENGTTMKITEYEGSEHLRCVFGVKLF